MTSCDWTWDATERVSLTAAPTDDPEALYHWLDDEVSGDVVLKYDENLNLIAFICEVDSDD